MSFSKNLQEHIHLYENWDSHTEILIVYHVSRGIFKGFEDIFFTN
jgi:hypothetical protein